jgi:hypothetical protein
MEGIGDEKVAKLNDLLIQASKILTSTFYTHAGRYDQDPAYGIPSLPGLQEAKKLAGMAPSSDEAGFLRTGMVREMNRVDSQISSATGLIVKATKVITANR